MNVHSKFLAACAALGVMLVASVASAQIVTYRVTSSHSLPSVPYVYHRPVVFPAVQPATVLSPVVALQPVVSQPVVASQPVVVSRPVVVASPVVTNPVVIRRGLFRRPLVVSTAPGAVVVPAAPVVSYPAPVTVNAGYAPSPVVVQRPVFVWP